MKLERVTEVAVFYEPDEGSRISVGRLALRSRAILFEYDASFLARGLEISPFKLPIARGVFEGKPEVLDGLMGVFDDSLPDGWGRLLIDRRAAELGLSTSSLTPLDRLSLVGTRSMGALVYEPAAVIDEPAVVKLSTLAKDAAAVQLDADGADIERLIAVGGSPQGARPKVLVQIAREGAIHFGAQRIEAGSTAWLVKFRARIDDPGSATLEHAYAAMARAAKIDMPRTRLLGKTKGDPGYFATERFDRKGTTKIHSHTLGGLLHLPHGYPALDYVDVLKSTRALTRNERAVAEMFRRACFNVLARNRDDHCRNIAFLMDEEGGWSLSPAYDLTFAEGHGGEHTTLVAGEGRDPTVADLMKVAEAVDLKRAATIVTEVRHAIDAFEAFAEEAGVPARLRQKVAKAIVPAAPTRGRAKATPARARAHGSTTARARVRGSGRRPGRGDV